MAKGRKDKVEKDAQKVVTEESVVVNKKIKATGRQEEPRTGRGQGQEARAAGDKMMLHH